MIDIVSLVTAFGVGIAVGMYISSQIENHIDKNTKK